MEDKNNILILGAGPAGMGAAFEFHKAAKPFTVIEKDERIGGLAKTLQYGEFRTDIGPHRFLAKNRYLYCCIEELLNENWTKVDRRTEFYINGKFFLYPINLKNALLNVGLYKGGRIIFDYLIEKIKSKFIKKELPSLEDKLISDFGRTLAELNMLNYTEKIWGLPCSNISSDWAVQRIEKLSLKEVIKKSFIKSHQNGPKTFADRFYYPETGTGLIYEKIKETISEKAADFKTNSYPVKIFHNGNRITAVIIDSDKQKNITYEPGHVISSIPITELVALLEPQAPVDILYSVKKLRFRSHLCIFITIDRPSVFLDQWIYFPDKDIPFGRVMEPKNFSKKMSPADRTSLLVEFFCWENDKIWNAGDKELFELTAEWLEKAGIIEKNALMDYFIHRERYAYPVYDLDYRGNLGKVKDYLNRFENLQYIGRSGRFRYNNQDHALEGGILAARGVLEGRQYNLEEIGSEQVCLEKNLF